MNKKIFIIVNELLRGGAQRIILDIARGIDHAEFDLHVVTLKAEGVFPPESKTLLNDLLKTGTKVTSIGGTQKFSLNEFLRLVRLLKREKPDVVHTYLPYASTVGRIAAKIAGIKNIISTQCNLPVAFSKKIYWLDKLTLPLARVWTGATESIEIHYGGSSKRFTQDLWESGRRHFTIVAGVDVEHIKNSKELSDREEKRRALGVGEGQKLILMTARLISWKGHEDAITALKHLPDEYHIAFAGWGPLENHLKLVTENLKLTERVHFLGIRDDIYALLNATDLYMQVFSHVKGGYVWAGPNTSLIEAAAAGIPIVSTEVPLIENLVEDGVTGKLAKIGDPKSHAQAVLWFEHNKDRIPEITAAARARVQKNYSVADMIRRTEELYRAMIKI